jgi:hypothetical protein
MKAARMKTWLQPCLLQSSIVRRDSPLLIVNTTQSSLQRHSFRLCNIAKRCCYLKSLRGPLVRCKIGRPWDSIIRIGATLSLQAAHQLRP